MDFLATASLDGRCPDAVSSGKPEEQQHTDSERDDGADKSQDEQDPRSASGVATASPPEITSAAPINVSCPNFMPSPPYPARWRRWSGYSTTSEVPAIPSRLCRLAQADATGDDRPPQTDQARGINDGAHVSLSNRPTGMCVDGMVDMCRWHGDFAMRYSLGRDPLLVQIA